jgi:hypothetical protein
MSAYKRINNSDVVISPYIANKQWAFESYELPDNGIQIFFGSLMTESFSAENDPVTYGRYERLVYDSINHMYYQNFSGSLDITSNLHSTNYESASKYRASGSYYDYSIAGYTYKNFPTGSGSQITVLSIPKNIYGIAVDPGTFVLSMSAAYIQDDGNQNLYVNSGGQQYYIGNLFYEHGIGVITDQNYQNLFPKPPLAKNDYVYFRSYDSPKTISPLTNDVARSGTLVPGSIVLSGSQASSFSNNGDGILTLNNTTGGVLSVYYTVSESLNDACGGYLGSNTAKIVATVYNCNFNGGYAVYVPPPTATPSPTATFSPTPTLPPSPTPTPSSSPSSTPVPTPSHTASPSPTGTATGTPFPTATLTGTPAPTPSSTGIPPDYYVVENCNNASITYVVNTPATFLNVGKIYTLTSTSDPTIFDGLTCWLVTSIVHTGLQKDNVSFDQQYDSCALCSIASFQANYGASLSAACSVTNLETIYYRGNLSSPGTILYTNPDMAAGHEAPNGYYLNVSAGNGQVYQVGLNMTYNNDGNIISVGNCPTPTPTPTPSLSALNLFLSGDSDASACANNYSVTVQVIGYTLCALGSSITIVGNTTGFNSLIGNSETFWLSDGTNAKRYNRVGLTYNATAVGGCTVC